MMKTYLKIGGFLLIALISISCSVARTDSGISSLNFDKISNADLQASSIIAIDSFNLEIIPPSMGVQYYRDGILFLSYSRYDDNMLPNHVSFGKPKAYFSNIYEGTLFKYADFSPTMPFPYPCDGVTFSNDFRTMYFTKIAPLDKKEKIYKATFTTADNFQTGWSADGFPLSFCQGDYVYSHPALSPDGKFMIVASNRKDSYGGMDLYLSSKEGNNWSELSNLGNTINSTSNDFYPFIDNQNNLYFSSDKKGGCGGYDIYVCKYNGKGWYKPVPLTNRVNTPGDEVAFTIDRKDGQSAFFSSVGTPGSGKPQLYRMTINNQAGKNVAKDLTAILYDMTGAHDEPATVPAFKVDTELASNTQGKGATTTGGNQSKKQATTSTQSKTPQSGTTTASSRATVNKTEAKPAEANAGTLTYRVQILSASKSSASYNVTVNNKTYKTYEYIYKGLYRITIGEFSAYPQALKLLNECHTAYPNAFVVVFRNNERVNDPSLLK
ncbi:MAG TPA: hypothetical protein PLR88_00185 [Bacteroidales bacterium]|nr:hypothetical protein [Bacteroidales bacterium]